MSLQQIATVMYGLMKEIHQKGFTPGDDNTIHIPMEKLSDMAKSETLYTSLSAVATQMENTKSLTPLFPNAPTASGPLAPPVPYNQPGSPNQINFVDDIHEPESNDATPEGNSVHLPAHLLSLLSDYGINHADINAACAILFPEQGAIS